MSRFFFFAFLFGLDEKLEKKERKRERKKEREKIYHIITMMINFFHEKYTTGKAQDSEKSALMD